MHESNKTSNRSIRGKVTCNPAFDLSDDITTLLFDGLLNKIEMIYRIITDHVPPKCFVGMARRRRPSDKALMGSQMLVVNVVTGAIVQRMDPLEYLPKNYYPVPPCRNQVTGLFSGFSFREKVAIYIKTRFGF